MGSGVWDLEYAVWTRAHKQVAESTGSAVRDVEYGVWDVQYGM